MSVSTNGERTVPLETLPIHFNCNWHSPSHHWFPFRIQRSWEHESTTCMDKTWSAFGGFGVYWNTPEISQSQSLWALFASMVEVKFNWTISPMRGLFMGLCTISFFFRKPKAFSARPAQTGIRQHPSFGRRVQHHRVRVIDLMRLSASIG